ncbi:thiamine-phosphate kinase [Microbaculum marinum]|uniref:Thiamine-monophosphate kinase n=1 Tax=Microbaculum marinum TaxID=1764581 RepID=A0AAW9S250_9HYPH
MSADGASIRDEHGLIETYFRPLAVAPGAFRLTDDAAAYTPPAGSDLVLTKDGIAEAIHFLPGEAAETIARKALRVNLSDLAAKGARPVGYLVLLGLGEDWTEEWIAGFAAGLAADQAEYGATLYGGDTIRSNGLLVSITAFGIVATGTMVRRSRARPGDRVFVTGTIGDGALGLLAARDDERVRGLSDEARAHLLDRYRLPRPRVELAPVLSQYATAALDVSDGLAGDLDKLCAASGVSARIAVEDVPLSPAARQAVDADPGLAMLCLCGGDDYEIVCTVPPDRARDFRVSAGSAGTPVAEIGVIEDGGSEATFLDARGRPVHFGERSFSHVRSTYSPD